jgi:hypothetical protein
MTPMFERAKAVIGFSKDLPYQNKKLVLGLCPEPAESTESLNMKFQDVHFNISVSSSRSSEWPLSKKFLRQTLILCEVYLLPYLRKFMRPFQ